MVKVKSIDLKRAEILLSLLILVVVLTTYLGGLFR